MRELLSLKNINLVADIGGAIASVLLSTAVVFLVRQNADQSEKLDCRAELAAATDVLRSEITIGLSQGLIAITEDNDAELALVIGQLRDLQDDLAKASIRRAQTVEICK